MLTRIERLEQLEKAETKIITKEIQHINSKLTNLDGLITQNIVGLNKKAEKTAIADIKSDLKYIRDQQISRYEFDTFMNLFLKSTEKSP